MPETGPSTDPTTHVIRYDFEVNAFRLSFQCAAPGSTWDTSGSVYVTNGDKIDAQPQGNIYLYNDAPKNSENRDSSKQLYYIRRHASACREIVCLLRNSTKAVCYHESIGKWQWAGLHAGTNVSSSFEFKPDDSASANDTGYSLRFSKSRLDFTNAGPGNGALAPDIILSREEPGSPEAHIHFRNTYSSDFPDPPSSRDLHLYFHVSLLEPICFMLSALLPDHPLSIRGYEKTANVPTPSDPNGPGIETTYRGIEMVGIFVRTNL